MKQNRPTTVAGAISLGQLNVAGLTQGLVATKNITAAVYSPVLAALSSARDDSTAARSAKLATQAELDRAAEAARIFILKVVDVLKPVFGRKFSADWSQLGFIRTLAVPKTHAGKQEILRSTATYLQTHPAAESPTHGVTAAIALEHSTNYNDALANVQGCILEVRAKRDACEARMEAVLKLMSDLVRELTTLIAADDPRWRGFGFNIPADPAVPDPVQNLIVTPGLPLSLILNWDAAPRGVRYHVEMLDSAPESEWTLVTTVAETSVTLTDLVPGASVQLRVVAANDGGEAVPSEPVSATVPMALAA